MRRIRRSRPKVARQVKAAQQLPPVYKFLLCLIVLFQFLATVQVLGSSDIEEPIKDIPTSNIPTSNQQSEAKSNVGQLSKFDNPLLNQLTQSASNQNVRPDQSPARDNKKRPVRNSADDDPATHWQMNSSKKNRPDKEDGTSDDNVLDNVLKKPVMDDNALLTDQLKRLIENQVPENPFYKFCHEFRKKFLSVHGYLSLAVCIFGIIANILNIIVLTR